jgi:hypothetical protein
MPPTETPPNPAPVAPPPPPGRTPDQPAKIVTRKFGELDHTELVHLLDSLEGDQAKARFRESIYISIIFYLLLMLLIIFGPKYVWHPGVVVPSAKDREAKQRLDELELNRDLAKLSQPKIPKVVPKIDQKTMQQLRELQRANEAARAARQVAPPAPTPAPAPPQPAPPAQNLPPAPTPVPAPLPRAAAPQPSAIPDAPRPNLPAAPQPPSQTPGQSIAEAARNTAPGRSGSRISGGGAPSRVGQQGAGTGPVDILSDTRGVDFTDYIKHILRMIKAGWIPLIPEECYPPLSKEGTTVIRFSIAKNGALLPPPAMSLDGPSHDRAIDKAAWGAIVGVGQYPPLPVAYTGDLLELRITFIISRNAPDDGY